MAPSVATADSRAGWAQARDGEPEAGLARLQRGIQAWKATGSRLHLPQWLSLLAEGLSLAGRAAEALAANDEAHRLTMTAGERCYEAKILWQRGHLLACGSGALDEAEASLGESLDRSYPVVNDAEC
jgi:predicted ATPase